jgi:hypothetical protein
MNTKLDQRLSIAPQPFPAQIDPWDMSRFAPGGLALATPLVMRPWDSLETVL